MNPYSAPRVLAASARIGLLAAALATMGFPGCPGDVTGPGGGSSDALTMSNCWPNDDGLQWTYAATWRQLDFGSLDYLPPGSTVPEVTMDDVRRMLGEPVTDYPAATAHYSFALRFADSVTTASGVRTQRLLELFDVPLAPGSAPVAGTFEGRLVARIAEARPDLRARLAGRSAASGRFGLLGPLFIHGYAWIKGPVYIGTYGDVDTLLAWKFLDSDLRAGHTFEHQLVPSLASDIWLRAKVEGRVTVDVPGRGRVRNAVSVIYLIDYGVSTATDNAGAIVGLYRIFDYGRVVYAPGTGPVRDLERRYAYLGQNVTLGFHELALDLVSNGPAPPGGPLAAARGR